MPFGSSFVFACSELFAWCILRVCIYLEISNLTWLDLTFSMKNIKSSGSFRDQKEPFRVLWLKRLSFKLFLRSWFGNAACVCKLKAHHFDSCCVERELIRSVINAERNQIATFNCLLYYRTFVQILYLFNAYSFILTIVTHVFSDNSNDQILTLHTFKPFNPVLMFRYLAQLSKSSLSAAKHKVHSSLMVGLIASDGRQITVLGTFFAEVPLQTGNMCSISSILARLALILWYGRWCCQSKMKITVHYEDSLFIFPR